MIRHEIERLILLGQLPLETDSRSENLKEWEVLILAIKPPISDEEALELVKVLGEDDAYGLAATLVNLIETAPSWPIKEALKKVTNPWVQHLKKAAENKGLL